MPIGFPSYYEDANGLQLGLCIGDPGCPSSPPVLEPVAPNDEAFWFMAGAEVGDFNSATAPAVRVDFAVEAAYIGEDPISFGRIQFTAEHLVPDATYTGPPPVGTGKFQVTPDGDPVGGDRAGAREETNGLFEDTLTSPIGPFLISTSAPAGYVGDGVTPTTAVGGPLRSSLTVTGPGLAAGGLTTDLFTVEGKQFDPTAPLPPPPVEPDVDGDGVIDRSDQCVNQVGPASNNGCPTPVVVERTVVQQVASAGAASGAPQGVRPQTAGGLRVSRLSLARRISISRLRSRGLAAGDAAQRWGERGRVAVYRARNGRKSGRALVTATRTPRAAGLFRTTLRSRKLRAGSYVMEVRVGGSIASLGPASRISFKVIR